MALSDVQICNRALHKLGAGTIISLEDNNEKGRVMKVAYESVRRAELRRRKWRFAIKRDSLAALSTAPISDYLYQYQTPNDFLRLIEGGDIASEVDLTDYVSANGGASYSVEGGKILTNRSAPLRIRYIADITDTALFDAAFAEALSMRLAYENCERLTESSSKSDECLRAYTLAIREAVRANALEVASTALADDTWMMGRTA